MRLQQNIKVLAYLTLVSLECYSQSTDVIMKIKLETAIVAWRGSVKKHFEKYCKIHRKPPVLGSFLNKVTDLQIATLLKERSSTGVFLWILLNFFRAPIWQNTCGQLLLYRELISLQKADFLERLWGSLSSMKSCLFQMFTENKAFQ